MPTTPQSAAGLPIDPPLSVPRPLIAPPAATAAPPPPSLPTVLGGGAGLGLGGASRPRGARGVRAHGAGGGEGAGGGQPPRLSDRQQCEVVGHVSSWIEGTRKNPSTAAGALARASAWDRHGLGTSSRNVLATSTTCAVGGIASVSSSFSRSMCARMPLSCSA